MSKPYFITDDFEKTASIPRGKSSQIQDIRAGVDDRLARIFRSDADITRISHERAIQYFESHSSDRDFHVAIDGGIYISDPDMTIDSTRMYPSESSILTDSGSYVITQRNGQPYEHQELCIPQDISSVTIYDDGMFSGDTMHNLIMKLRGVRDIPMRVRVLLNFSGVDRLGDARVDSYYRGDCLDWIDERDFYYGLKNSGASIQQSGVVSGVPYISNPLLATKKASIPQKESKRFCLDMIDNNKDLWEIIDPDIRLKDIPRIAYLQDRYSPESLMQDVLEQEKQKILSNY